MDSRLQRRSLLLGVSALLAGARGARAVEPAAVMGLLAPNNDEAKRHAWQKDGFVAVAEMRAPRGWAAGLAQHGDTILAALLAPDGSRLLAGPSSIPVLALDPFSSPILSIDPAPLGHAVPAFAIRVANSYLSPARSSYSDATHIVLYRDGKLFPVFRGYLRAGTSFEAPCRVPKEGGAPCQRGWTRAYTIRPDPVTRAGLPPTLRVRAENGRQVSRHIWFDGTYHPPVFDDVPPPPAQGRAEWSSITR